MGSAYILKHSGTFCIHYAFIPGHSASFWNILEHSGTFWNILEHSGTFWNILEHSGSFCNILEHSGTVHYYIECRKKVEFLRQTDTQTLGLVELLFAAKNP